MDTVVHIAALILSLSLQNHGMSFHLFRSSTSLSSFCSFQCRCFEFIPNLFILSDDIVNGIAFLISFLDSLLLMYRIQLILYIDLVSCTLQNLFTGSSQGFFSGFLRIFYKQDHFMCKQITLLLPFLYGHISFFILFTCSGQNLICGNRSYAEQQR